MSLASTRGGGATVFVVDDDEWLRPALCRMLEGAGFTVQAYADGPSLLAAIKPDTRGCVVMDQTMPSMTGLQLLEQMKHRGLKMPSILLTGSGNPSIEGQARSLGAFAYLDKPVAGQLLLECVRRALDSGTGGRGQPRFQA